MTCTWPGASSPECPAAPNGDTYSYDADGNRLTKNSTAYTYDAADQMTPAYSYDLNGNQTSRGTSTLNYDHQNRLTKINPPNTPSPDDPCYDVNGDGIVDITDLAQIANRFGAGLGSPQYDAFYDLNSDGAIDIQDLAAVAGQFGKTCPSRFTYNGDGLRVVRGGGWLSSNYVWDVASSLPVILKETDSHNVAANGQGVNNTYVYGLGLISVTDRTGNQTYYTSDGLGSTTDLTNSSGAKTDGYSYDAFGTATHSPGSSTQAFQFTGQQIDSDSSLYYVRARYYDASTGRFLSKDPRTGYIQTPMTQNPYIYTLNNPCNNTDPTGLESESGDSVTYCHATITLKGAGGLFQIPCGWGKHCDWFPGDHLATLTVEAVIRSGNKPKLVAASGDPNEFWHWYSSADPLTYATQDNVGAVAWFHTDRNGILEGSAILQVAFNLDPGGVWRAYTSIHTSDFGGTSFLLNTDVSAGCTTLPYPGG